MKLKKKVVIRTLSKKYQLTIPKKFGEDLGLEPLTPVTIREDVYAKQIIIEPLPVPTSEKMRLKESFDEACRYLGKKWEKLGVSEEDVQKAIREYRKGA